MTLTYTINRLLLLQRTNIERDLAKLDEYGGEPKAKREVVHANVHCRFWWWREAAARSPSKEYATTQRTIHFTGGGVLVPLGTDLRNGDHLTDIKNIHGVTIIAGPFRVIAVEQIEDHLESALMRP